MATRPSPLGLTGAAEGFVDTFQVIETLRTANKELELRKMTEARLARQQQFKQNIDLLGLVPESDMGFNEFFENNLEVATFFNTMSPGFTDSLGDLPVNAQTLETMRAETVQLGLSSEDPVIVESTKNAITPGIEMFGTDEQVELAGSNRDMANRVAIQTNMFLNGLLKERPELAADVLNLTREDFAIAGQETRSPTVINALRSTMDTGGSDRYRSLGTTGAAAIGAAIGTTPNPLDVENAFIARDILNNPNSSPELKAQAQRLVDGYKTDIDPGLRGIYQYVFEGSIADLPDDIRSPDLVFEGLTTEQQVVLRQAIVDNAPAATLVPQKPPNIGQSISRFFRLSGGPQVTSAGQERQRQQDAAITEGGEGTVEDAAAQVTAEDIGALKQIVSGLGSDARNTLMNDESGFGPQIVAAIDEIDSDALGIGGPRLDGVIDQLFGVDTEGGGSAAPTTGFSDPVSNVLSRDATLLLNSTPNASRYADKRITQLRSELDIRSGRGLALRQIARKEFELYDIRNRILADRINNPGESDPDLENSLVVVRNQLQAAREAVRNER